MAQHDRYENDLLKQLTRIANSLEKIEKKIPNIEKELPCDHDDEDSLLACKTCIHYGKHTLICSVCEFKSRYERKMF